MRAVGCEVGGKSLCAVVDEAVLNDVRAVGADGIGCGGGKHAGLPQSNLQSQGLLKGSSNGLLLNSASPLPRSRGLTVLNATLVSFNLQRPMHVIARVHPN